MTIIILRCGQMFLPALVFVYPWYTFGIGKPFLKSATFALLLRKELYCLQRQSRKRIIIQIIQTNHYRVRNLRKLWRREINRTFFFKKCSFTCVYYKNIVSLQHFLCSTFCAIL